MGGNDENIRIKRPKGRKRMIRDLPPKLAKYLHPSLRNILASRQKRWNRGSPHFRLAVNLINRYRRPIKPRVLPFFCDNCHLATRRLDLILHHGCSLEKKKKDPRRYTPYDFSQDVKMAQNAYKCIRKNGLAVMEKTPKPQHIQLPSYNKIANIIPGVQVISKVAKLQDLCYSALEFEDPEEGIKIDKIMIANGEYGEINHKCLMHASSGKFCFHCRKLFNDIDEYSAHIDKDNEKATCALKVPDYYDIQTEERIGTISADMAFRVRKHRPVKRNVSHIKCTLCHAGNFESTDALYSHMLKCENLICEPQ